MGKVEIQAIQSQVDALEWYHTLDLGHGIVTPGHYDHRPYLAYYGLPRDLSGKTALDIGAASGFFSFEMERRGAQVTATDLPAWMDHDFGPTYRPDKTPQEAQRYLHDPLALAKRVLGSRVKKREINIYDISPETVGKFDLVFCGSVLLHLTDPIQALWRIQSVTRGVAIVATAICHGAGGRPLAQFVGHHGADEWWIPNRNGLEMMVQSAGFEGWEWFSEFRLDRRDGRAGPYHGVIRAWNTLERPDLPAAEVDLGVVAPRAVEDDLGPQDRGLDPRNRGLDPRNRGLDPRNRGLERALAERDTEIARLHELVARYERGRFMRLMRFFNRALGRLQASWRR